MVQNDSVINFKFNQSPVSRKNKSKLAGIWYTLKKPTGNWLSAHFPEGYIYELEVINPLLNKPQLYPPRKLIGKHYNELNNNLEIVQLSSWYEGIYVDRIKYIHLWIRYNYRNHINSGLSKFQALYRCWLHRNTLKEMRHQKYKPQGPGFFKAKYEFNSLVNKNSNFDQDA